MGSTATKSNLVYSLAALGAMVRTRDLVIADIDELVEEARAAGATWEQVGKALGIARQNAHRLYSENREHQLEQRREAAAVRARVVRAAGLSVL